MKEANKNSLLNYFSKKKTSDVQPNAENSKRETVEQKSTKQGDELVDAKEKTQKMIKEIISKEGGKPKEKKKAEIKSGQNLPQKTLTKRKRKDEVDDTDEDDGEGRRRKFKALSKELRAAIAIAQLMELSDDGDADDESDAGLKNKKSKASSSGDVKQAKKPAKSTKKQNGTSKSTVERPKVEIPTEKDAKYKEKALGDAEESTSLPKKNKESNNTAENLDEKCKEGENAKKMQCKKKTELSPKKLANPERQKKDISSFFTKLKKRE